MSKQTLRESFEEIRNMSREELIKSFKATTEEILVNFERLDKLVETQSSDIEVQ